ncbi:MAG: M20 family metallopeptidase [Armatimonadota bacterium]|nr:M20 family metallopeptidase [Armatimonadota bacterium]MDR7499818.1 M20 family metallopeptidase [Armatimonadota bacterium]MDR7505236.1 M20 family metallopeptidase [Armatimonadota bacterium]
MFTEDDVAPLLRQLVAIPSVNPAFQEGAGEGALAEFVAAYLRELGAFVQMQEVYPGRFNVIGRLRNSDAAQGLLLEAHLDTVQVTGMTVEPFGGEIRAGRLYGRGACDTKASLAAMLLAMRALRDTPPAHEVLLAALVDEEVMFAGARALAASGLRAAGAIVGEPTDLHLVIAHKGVVRFHAEVVGKAAHSATPAEGVNAIEGMLRIIEYLCGERTDLPAAPAHPLTGPPTVCVTRIEGGSGANTVPERCTIHVDRRVIPGERPEVVYRDLREGIGRAAAGFPGQIVVHEPYLVGDPMETPPDTPVVRALASAVTAVTGRSDLVGRPFATDASVLTAAGIPCVVFGPGSLQHAHTASESVSLAEVARAAEILVRTAQLF